MKKLSLSVGLVGLGLLMAACSGAGDEPAPFESSPDLSTVTSKLEQLTGSRWMADVDPTTQRTSLFLALTDGHSVVSAQEPQTVLGFMDVLKGELGVSQSFDREFGEGEITTEASSERLGTVRFRQHVPGSKVPVFDSALTVGVKQDGSLAYIERTGGNRMEGFRTTPAIDASAAIRTAVSTVPASIAAEGQTPELGVVAANPDAPLLAYRVVVLDANQVPFRVEVDAITGTMISVQPFSASGTPIQGLAAASNYPNKDKKFVQGKTLPVEIENNTLRVAGAAGTIAANDATMLFQPPVRLQSFSTGYGENLDGSAALESGTAVDAVRNVKLAADYFANQFGHRSWAAKTINVNVHFPLVSSRPTAYFNPADSQIYVQDGTLNGAGSQHTYYSPATSLDYMAHEYSHGVIWEVAQLPFTGESGAIQEGLSDIFGASAEALFTNSAAGLFSFAGDQRADSRYNRHYLHPTWGADGGANHYDNMRSRTSLVDQGNVHFNSTVVSHPWALMVWGGYNDTSKIGVTAEIGLPRATALFWDTLRSITGPSTIRAFANKMIAYQIGNDPVHPART